MQSEDHPRAPQGANEPAQEIASRFVAARRDARPLAEFPGTAPTSLDAAYVIQDRAIALRGGKIGGWKVGRIPIAIEKRFGIDRLAGPIFSETIYVAKADETTELAAYAGGFIALEAEFVVVIAHDAPPGKTSWSSDESAALIGDVCIGMELASSPLSIINDLGPAVVVSDFGNNAGLIVGPPITNWQTRPPESMQCTSYIDGAKVGDGGAFKLDGGMVRSVQFLLELNARRGFPLKAGDVVATGQTTGVHKIQVGQIGKIDFGDDGVVRCRIIKA